MSFQNRMGEALKNLVESRGVDGAVVVIKEALKTGKIAAGQLSLKEMWEACEPGRPVTEAVSSGSFPKMTGALIHSTLIKAYDSVKLVGDLLVTNTPTNLENPDVAGVTGAETPEETGQGQEIPSSSVTEKSVRGNTKKYAKRIDITEEMIFFDKTGEVINRTRGIGKKAAQYKDKLIVEGVQDINTNVYQPGGVPTAFYSSANGNLQGSNGFGESGLEKIMILASQMKDDALGKENNDFIMIDPLDTILLIPQDLWVQAQQMAGSALTPEGAENAMNVFKDRFKVVTSPYVGQQSINTWYWGDFKEDFWWMDVWPLSVISLRPGSDIEFFKEIKASHKVRFFGGIMSVDFRHSFKSTA